MKLLEALRAVHEDMQDERHPLRMFGLCYAVEQKFEYAIAPVKLSELESRYVSEVSGKFAGKIGFPVHGGGSSFFAHADKWDRDTEYGRHRWEYLDWLIQQLEAEE